MSDLSLIGPTVGLTSIARFEADHTGAARKKSDYTPIGGRVVQNVRSLYEHTTVKDVALALSVPVIMDPDLLQPQRFESALLDAFDKIDAQVREDPTTGAAAHKTLAGIKAAWAQCRDNIAALNQA